ncbi:MAG: (d)CMP kinase [Thermodesulfobacteriota bacterium]
MARRPIVTIDGPSGAGKSTVSRLVAARLGFTYLDTGAMYRAAGLKAQRQGVDLDDTAALAALLDSLDLRLAPGSEDTRVYLDGEDVSRAIRSAQMGLVASAISAKALVRERLVALQRQLAAGGGVVAEGRDTGTVVFPDAEHKFYLDASASERARRRVEQLALQGMPADFATILAQIEKRDRDDSSRDLSPLRPAADAVRIDSSAMDAATVAELIASRVRSRP